jgi:hypothetical protein
MTGLYHIDRYLSMWYEGGKVNLSYPDLIRRLRDAAAKVSSWPASGFWDDYI